MPVAEPSGEYQLDLSLDLSPIYGTIEDRQTVTVSQPPADILDRRLAECASDDAATRMFAVRDLAYFRENGDRVFPALARCLDDADGSVREAVVYSMGRFPEQIAQHSEAVMRALGDASMDASRRGYAAYLLSEHGPLTEQVSEALTAAAEAVGADEHDRFADALARFNARREAEGSQ